MFGRIFGRGKDETDQAVCAQCGRTLLVGEWTQNVVGADGQEYLICSLCGQSAALADVEPVATGTTPANNGRVRESRTDLPQGLEYGAAADPLAPPPEPAAAPAPVAAPAAAAAFVAAAPQADDSRDAHGESDAFWRALKEKDAEIERLQAELARMDAEKQELAGQLALARTQLGTRAAQAAVPQQPLVPAAAALAFAAQAEAPAAEAPATAEAVDAETDVVVSAEVAAVLTHEPAEPPRVDASEPGERTWGETPAEFAAELAALRDEEVALQPAADVPVEPVPAVPVFAAAQPAAAEPQAASPGVPVAEPVATPVAAETGGIPPIVFENTQPIPALTDEVIAADAASQAAASLPFEESETTLTPETGGPVAAAAFGVAAAASLQSQASTAPAEPTAAELEAEAANLTLLQRGVDLLNVSPVPRKIAETSDQLGIPMVNVSFDGQSTLVTFMWSMGWYRYDVDADSGAVRMGDRGYEELTDLRPNASVRADGTVQLAPAQISRAAKAPAGYEPEPPTAPPAGPAPAPAPTSAPAEPEPPSVAAQKAPEILSKSLLGQRSDDDVASWEQTQAREFDWNR